MKLSDFLQDLWEKGEVTVAGKLFPFAGEDLRESVTVLRKHYDEDSLEMPGEAPQFSPEAGLWAAQYLYHSVQLAVLRDLGEEVIKEQLQEFREIITPEAVYSVDLTFRYLPDLLHLTKGLAPDDILVTKLRQATAQWPFSSVGVALQGEPDLDNILSHPSLKQAYADRIIKAKDRGRMNHPGVKELIEQALGQYDAVLWPDFKNFSKQL